jgi:predicted LPLAT superfamily acyltransferase
MKRWTDKAERGSVWLIRLIAWLARTAGRPLCRLLLYPIVLYFVLFDPTARRASMEFLEAARGRPARWKDAFAHIYSFAATLLDRVYMAAGACSSDRTSAASTSCCSRSGKWTDAPSM